MLVDATFQFVLRTPRAEVFARPIASLRVPTETGQVGLRPRHEELVLAIEPGLVLARENNRSYFMGTSGGILCSDGNNVQLLTPLAVVGDTTDDVVAALELAFASPDSEMQARAKLSRLETNIVNQLRQPARPAPTMVRK